MTDDAADRAATRPRAPIRTRYYCKRCGNELRRNEMRRGVYSRWSWAGFVAGAGLMLLLPRSIVERLFGRAFEAPRVTRFRCLDCGHREDRPVGRERGDDPE